MTKKVLAALVVLILAGTAGLVAGCGGNLPKGAVAKVGSVIITQKAFDQRTADFEVQYASQGIIPDKTTQPEQYKLFQQDVLEYMITYELASQAAEDMNITVTDDEVQQEMDSILQQSFGGDQSQFDQALEAQGITMDQLKNSYKESMLLQKVYEQVTKDITTVPDNELQAYYDEHKSDYYVAETRTARHILLAPDASRVDGTTSTTTTSTTEAGADDSSTATASSSTTTTAAPTDADWEAALEAAKKVEAQLKAGADWTEEAKTYSDDPGSKEIGGDLGTIQKGEMVPEFEDAVFSLQKDEISDPVKTAYGYHIIEVTGINEAKQYTLDEVKQEITSILLGDKKDEAWTKWEDDQRVKVGVVYADAWVTTTTTSSTDVTPTSTDGTDTTTGAEDTTTTAPASTETTAPASTTTTAATTTQTTAGATDTTTAP